MLGDSTKLGEMSCPSSTNVVFNDDEAMDFPTPAQATEHYAEPTRNELTVLRCPLIEPEEEVCFGMVSNSNVFKHQSSDFKIGLKYPCPAR
jgi:hypothetical protein